MAKKKIPFDHQKPILTNDVKVGMILQTFSPEGQKLTKHEVLRKTLLKDGMVLFLLDNNTPDGTEWTLDREESVYEA